MDKQKDFEKGWEEQKAKKKQEIEEMVEAVYPWLKELPIDERKQLRENVSGLMVMERLYNAGYRKIPENAVVLTEERNKIICDRFAQLERVQAELQELNAKYYNEAKDLRRELKRVRKETAEKFAERLKELEEALLDMVVQFCQMGECGKLKHAFMSAEEQAFDILDIKYGEKVDKVYKRFNKKWSKPIDEIAKELTGGKV